jgi:signal peptidase I
LQPDPVAPAEFPGAAPAPAAPVKEDASMAWMAREIIETVVLALVIFLLIRQGVQNYRIENHSMEPNFYEGQFVLVNKLAYKLGGAPERGDVVVFHNPNNTAEDYIKRPAGERALSAQPDTGRLCHGCRHCAARHAFCDGGQSPEFQ